MAIHRIAARPANSAERRLLGACSSGASLALQGETVRADFIRALLITGAANAAGLRLSGATIRGTLDLENARQIADGGTLPALHLEQCTFAPVATGQPSINITHVRLAHLSLRGSRFHLLNGEFAQIEGALDLAHIATAGTIQPLSWPGHDASQYAAWFESMIAQAPIAHPPRNVAPTPPQPRDQCVIKLRGAQIGGALSLKQTRLAASAGEPAALNLAECRMSGSLDAQELHANGLCDLDSVRIGSDLRLDGALLVSIKGESISLRGASIEGRAYFSNYNANPFRAYGGITLTRLRAGGTVNFHGAQIDVGAGAPPLGRALNMESANVGGSCLLTGGFVCTGQLWLFGAQIAHSLSLTNCRIESDKTKAIHAENARIGAMMRLEDSVLKGAIEASDARIGQTLYLRGTTIEPVDKVALCLDNIDIGASFSARKSKSGRPFRSGGSISMSRARIGGNIQFEDALLDGEVQLVGARAQGALRLKRNTSSSTFDLRALQCDELEDSSDGYGSGPLRLDGLTYRHLSSPIFDSAAQARIDWLKRHVDEAGNVVLNSQAFTKAASVLARQGCNEASREVLCALEDQTHADAKAARGKIRTPYALAQTIAIIAHGWFGAWFGYGIKPAHAIRTLCVSLLVGLIFFTFLFARGAMVVAHVPVAQGIFKFEPAALRLTEEYAFAGVPCTGPVTPYLYTIDVFVPFLDLQQESACEIGEGPTHDLFDGIFIREIGWTFFAEADAYEFIQTMFAIWGWICTSLAILTFSGVFLVRPRTD